MRKTAVVKPADDGCTLSCGAVTLWFPDVDQAIAYAAGRLRNYDVEVFDARQQVVRRIEAERPRVEPVGEWLNPPPY